jgi:hypothetical protein
MEKDFFLKHNRVFYSNRVKLNRNLGLEKDFSSKRTLKASKTSYTHI